MMPTLVIDLSTIRHFSEIYQLMHGIRAYVYIFRHRNGIWIKVGMSGACQERDGDRLYRQAGHLEGWWSRLQGSSGADMRNIAWLWQQQHGTALVRQDVIIEVYDLTRTGMDCEQVERDMIDQHLAAHGRAPIGNIDRQSLLSERRLANQSRLDQLFDWR